MNELVKKLIEKKIFKKDTLIEAVITKSFMGSPVKKQVTLRVKQIAEDHCLVDEVELFDKSFNVEEFEEDEDRRSDAYQDLANRHYA